MANTEIFLRNIFGTTRPNIRPLVLALNITNDLLFEQHISMSGSVKEFSQIGLQFLG